MFCLDNTDLIQGDADNATEVDFTIHGLVGTTFTVLADGQLAGAKGTLYTAGAAISVVCVTLVNTGAAAQAVNLYLDSAAGGNSRRMIPEDMSLGIGYSLHFDGQRCSVMNASGAILYTYTAHTHDGETLTIDGVNSDGGAFAFTTSGLVTFSQNIAFAGQLGFPATAVPSADVNTLDDYEEGSWTPGVSFGGGVVGITYSTISGFYTKIGNIVNISGRITLTNKGTSVGDAIITGLPFTINNSPGANGSLSLNLAVVSFANQFLGYFTINTTTMSLYESTEAGVSTALVNTNFANNSSLYFSSTYRVA